MSSNHVNNRNRQCHSEMASNYLPIINNKNNNSHVFQTGKLTSIALLVGSASLVLTGCQSNPTASADVAASSTLMDLQC